MVKKNKILLRVRHYLSTVKRAQPNWAKDTTRARWMDEIIRVLLNVDECFVANESFYRGKKGQDPWKLAAHVLEQSMFTPIKHHLKYGIDALKDFPNEEQREVFQMASLAFEVRLNEVLGTAARRRLPLTIDSLILLLADCREGRGDRKGLKRNARTYVLALAEAAYRLKVREHEIWLEHPNWEISGFEWEPDGPYDCREWMNNRARALLEFDRRHGDVFLKVHEFGLRLDDLCESLPRAFLSHDLLTERPESFADSVRAVLLTPPDISYANPVASARWQRESFDRCRPSETLCEERTDLINELIDYFQHRAVTSKSGSAERRKWLEAEAELLSDVSGVYDESAVDRIIALANDAQRESWIESKMDNCKKDDVERLAIDPSLAPPAPQQRIEARLDADTNRKLSELFDRLDAAKPGAKPGPKGKAVSRTKPLMGPSTTTMKRQLTRFVKFVVKNPIDRTKRAKTPGARANQFWNKHKAEFEAAAKRGGARKGYSCAKCLAGAYATSQLIH